MTISFIFILYRPAFRALISLVRCLATQLTLELFAANPKTTMTMFYLTRRNH